MTSLKIQYDQLDDAWIPLTETVDSILAGKIVSKLEWQNTFTYVYQIRMYDSEDGKGTLINYLVEKLTNYVLELKKQILPKCEESLFLESYIKCWRTFDHMARCLMELFIHLDVHCFENVTPVMRTPIGQVFMGVWLRQVYQPMESDLMDTTFRLIDDERCGAVINRNLVIDLKESLMRLQGYTYGLSARYVDELEICYPPRTAKYIEENGIRAYITHALKMIEMEEKATSSYLAADTIPEVMKHVVMTIVEKHLDQLLLEVKSLLAEGNYEYLNYCYRLISRTADGLKPTFPILEKHMHESGMQVLLQEAKSLHKDPHKYVTVLLRIFNQSNDEICKVFANDASILTLRDKVFQTLVNNTKIFTLEIPDSKGATSRQVESRCPELLALYYDRYLRKRGTSKKVTDEKLAAALEDVLLILKYIESKDVFMRFYKSNLMRRLLLNASEDNQLEESVVEQLTKAGMPGDHVRPLEQMFKDTKLSADLTATFKKHCREQKMVNPDAYTLMVLNSGSWLLSSDIKQDISIPTECQDVLASMKQFYLNKHKGRQLTWQHYLSHGVLSYKSDCGTFDLLLTVHQIVVVYAWYRRPDDKFSLEALSIATGLGDRELRRAIWTLTSNPKQTSHLLLYSPKVAKHSEFTPNTEFQLNLKFNSISKRVNLIGHLPLTQGTDTDDYATKPIYSMRKLRTEEAITKVMKTRKEMHMDDIYVEVVDTLKNHFLPSKYFVKETLDMLVSENKMGRSETDSDKFSYIE